MRCALDLGSGSVKCAVMRGSETLFARETEALVAMDVKSRGCIGAACEAALHASVREYCRVARSDFAAVSVCGVATAAYRSAANGAEVVERLNKEHGAGIRIVTQADEGRLGFLAGRALCDWREPLIVFDSGAASFQLSSQDSVYEGPWGSVSAWRLLLEIQGRKETDSVLPVEERRVEELVAALRAAMPPPPPWLQACRQVAAIGGPTSMFQMLHVATRTRSFTAESARAVLRQLVGKTSAEVAAVNAEFVQIELLVGKVALLVAVLEHLPNVERVEHFFSIGVCAGVLQS